MVYGKQGENTEYRIDDQGPKQITDPPKIPFLTEFRLSFSNE